MISTMGTIYQRIRQYSRMLGKRIPNDIFATNTSYDRAMCRNSKVYPDPEVFRPERFLVEEGKEAPLDPSKIAFGFGRRLGNMAFSFIQFLY